MNSIWLPLKLIFSLCITGRWRALCPYGFSSRSAIILLLLLAALHEASFNWLPMNSSGHFLLIRADISYFFPQCWGEMEVRERLPLFLVRPWISNWQSYNSVSKVMYAPDLWNIQPYLYPTLTTICSITFLIYHLENCFLVPKVSHHVQVLWKMRWNCPCSPHLLRSWGRGENKPLT